MVNRLPLGENIFPLGVFSNSERVFFYYNSLDGKNPLFQLDISSDGFSFEKHQFLPKILDNKKRVNSTKNISDFRISPQNNGKHFLTYKENHGKENFLSGAFSFDLVNWQSIDKLLLVQQTAVVVSKYKHRDDYVMYYGDNCINIAFSKDLKMWKKVKNPLLTPFGNYFGFSPLKVANVFMVDEGILLFYYSHTKGSSFDRFSLHSVLFDKQNPKKIIKKIRGSIWDSTEEWGEKSAKPVGVVKFQNQLLSYWHVDGKGIFAIIHSFFEERKLRRKSRRKTTRLILKKFRNNPIIRPIVENFWESKATFNTAALYEDGKVHLVYRAIGDTDVSVLGYAASKDGVNIDERHSKPIYTPREPFETGIPEGEKPSISPFTSGGGCFGGCEDPRLTKVGDKIYMTYVAYNGSNHPRSALTSIKTDDFLAHNWKWQKPVLISKPGMVNKNAVIFPEKINGKYVIYHRVYPNILIDFVDDLKFDGKTKFLEGHYEIRPKNTSWDSRKVGAGAPPIKTKDGWLLIYHAVGDQDPLRYKIGAMLLDLKDPTRVLYRTKKPLLQPTKWYENEGHKFGVAYPCGSVVVGDKLHVYYGGADTVVCVASARFSTFLKKLKSSELAELSPVRMSYKQPNA